MRHFAIAIAKSTKAHLLGFFISIRAKQRMLRHTGVNIGLTARAADFFAKLRHAVDAGAVL